MIPSLISPPIMAMILGIISFIVFTLLPSIIELKKPKDPGPRVIREYDLMHLHDLDVKQTYEANANPLIFSEVAAILAFLHDIES